MLTPVLVALAWLFLLPEPAAAWGPGTHIALGELILGGGLGLLPPALQALLSAHPLDFLYGSIAADISFAKKYAPVGRHCHHWHVGQEILTSADSERLQAVGWGYLSHLAADTVAHNLFVPRRLLLTSTTQALGHTYWEHRMDMHVGNRFLGQAGRLITDYDHEPADALFDRVLSRTLFSFETNRRIFRGMIRVSDNDRWQRVFDAVLRKSRYDLPDEVVLDYVALSFEAVVDYLRHTDESTPAGSDPIGDLNLKLAKKVRRLTMARGGAEDATHLAHSADEFFPLPQEPLRFWPTVAGDLSGWVAPGDEDGGDGGADGGDQS